jgi:hypothetical protein
MSGVVLRCPNCGTTKAAPGECQACHQAEVRYYCTNHTPGHWLDAPKCPECGARFGDPAHPPVARRPRVRKPAPPPAASARRKRSVPWLPERAVGPWVRRIRPPARDDGATPRYGSDEAPDPRKASWPDLLREAAQARRMRAEAKPVPDTAAVGMALGGCLMRAVFLVVLLFAALLIFSLIAGGLLFQGFGVYW